MITVQCSCGETYHAEEKYIGASILCTSTKCGQVIPIAPLSRATPPNTPVNSHRWNTPVPLDRRRIHPSKRTIIVCGILVALAIGLAVLARLRTNSAKNGNASNQSPSAAAAPSAGSNAFRSDDNSLKSPTSEGRPQVNGSNGKGGSERVEPSPSGINDVLHDPATEKRAPKPVEPVSPMAVPPPSEALLKEIEPLNPKRLPTGAAPFGPGTRSGNSILTVENGTDTDALVRVIRFLNGEQLTRNFYIIAGKSFSAREVPPGDYVLRIAFGKDWNESARGFNYRRLFSETQHFEMREETSEDEAATRIRYSRMSITLHQVVNGNFASHPISEEAFWR
jgi:hypothetical protein